MQSVTCAVIAAAGLGSRLGHGLPKCMLEIDGETILSRLIAALRGQVEQIHVVVGYREDLVIDLCAREHRNVVLVRNPSFRVTSAAQSMALGARACSGKILFLDGDLLITKQSLHSFLAYAGRHPFLAGIASMRSENAVGVDIRSDDESSGCTVEKFVRGKNTVYEWANVFAAPADILAGAGGYVYEKLSEHLPMQARELNLREIDTQADYEAATIFAKTVLDNE